MKTSLTEMDSTVSFLLLALTRLAGVGSVEVLDDWALPTVVQKGDKVDLRCNYKLEGENMYSLKWYRDDVEFYRYIPTEAPSTTVFVMPGLEVLDRSTPTHIILNNVASHTSGVFKCEVSAGPPRFSTASRTTHLQIVDLPTSKPHIYGLRSVYEVGSLLNLSCESGPSSPPPQLHWFLNGVKLGPEGNMGSVTVTDIETAFPLDDKKGISGSQLKFLLTNQNLARVPQKIVVKCVAVIKEFYRKGVKVVVKVRGRKVDGGEGDQDTVTEKTTEDWLDNVSLNTGVTSHSSQSDILCFVSVVSLVRCFL